MARSLLALGQAVGDTSGSVSLISCSGGQNSNVSLNTDFVVESVNTPFGVPDPWTIGSTGTAYASLSGSGDHWTMIRDNPSNYAWGSGNVIASGNGKTASISGGSGTSGYVYYTFNDGGFSSGAVDYGTSMYQNFSIQAATHTITFLAYTTTGAAISPAISASYTPPGEATPAAGPGEIRFGATAVAHGATVDVEDGGVPQFSVPATHGTLCNKTVSQYEFASWRLGTYDGTLLSSSTSYSWTVTADRTIVAVYNQNCAGEGSSV